MKGAFETFLIFFFGMTFVLLGFSMVEVTFNYNKARLYQETIVSLIERHDRYDNDVDALIKEASQNCATCTYRVTENGNRYTVEVNFDIHVRILNYKKVGSIMSYTQNLQ